MDSSVVMVSSTGSTTDTDVHYRRCGRCGQWQREVFRSGRFADVDQPYDSEPDLGSPYFD
ncbi:hypothetical protein [Rhodococcus sp. 05-2255-3B1]|uniref:hypothetical protein n=1 Tax=Rhodococcus sp. 05-2255-3B1 TaxID=2022482 RepID=UPI00117BC2D9|nr:hypothetical protein [Rhodococcus sp. 05-2255-3B1]